MGLLPLLSSAAHHATGAEDSVIAGIHGRELQHLPCYHYVDPAIHRPSFDRLVGSCMFV